MATEPDQNYDFDEACRFVIKLGMAAHRYGSNSARLEAFLLRARKALGFRSAFRSRPNNPSLVGPWKRPTKQSDPPFDL